MSASSQELRFGICGLGFMGRMYFGCLRDHPRARVVAVCDSDPAVFSGDWRPPTGNIQPQETERVHLSAVAKYARAEELVSDPRVEVVAITLPTPWHADVTVRALAAGKHVICEKPMARELADCDRMIRAAEQARRTLMIGQCIRFWPEYETVVRLIRAGRIGQVRFAKLERLASMPTYSHENWLLNGAASGGALFDLHVHDVDFAHYLLGVPEVVHARGCRGPSGEIDHVFATYGYADGRYALLEGSWAYHAPWPFEMAITVCGEAGTLTWSSLAGSEVRLYTGAEEPARMACPDETGWQRQLDYFIACVTEGRPVARCRPTSSRTSVALALLERESIERGALLPVPAQVRDGDLGGAGAGGVKSRVKM